MSKHANELLAFIDGSPSPYHAVERSVAMLSNAGFEQVFENEKWKCEAGGAYFTVRDGKSLIAWRQGVESPEETGFRIVAAHSDSPALKLRARLGNHGNGAHWLKPDLYGSLLLHTWLDRDIRPTGVVFHTGESGEVERSLVDLDTLKLRACSLAPHLRKNKLDPSLLIDREDDMLVLYSVDSAPAEDFHALLAKAVGCGEEAVIGYDIFLADTQPSAIIGAENELISAPRLDNLFSSFSAIAALIDLPKQSQSTRVAAIFDAEEIGSQTWTGARSTLLSSALDRIVAQYGETDTETEHKARARSLFASLDMAHAEHPSHPATIDPDHVPVINGGIALKGGSRGNYAIAPYAIAKFEDACRRENLPLQSFMYRCDHGGGSSVGPIASSALGIPGFDLGAPLISMHSIREVAGVQDLTYCTKTLGAFYRM